MATSDRKGGFDRGIAIVGWLLLTAVGCSGTGGSGAGPVVDTELARARELARSFLIVDTHVDLPWRLETKAEDVSRRTESGDFDYPRAVEGGLDAPFMSIFVPASYQESGGAKRKADALIDMVEGIVAGAPDKFAIATSVAEVRRHFEAGLVSLPMGMENGAPIEGDLANLRHFFDRGIRYITLTHGKDNRICDSSYDESRTWGGLSPFGREVVEEMNRLGIMIDVSHVSDDAFYQVLQLTRAPVIASHSSCRHFTPGWERNMDDAMIRALAQNGGVIQINFGSSFLDQRYNDESRARREEIGRLLEERGLSRETDEGRAFAEVYEKQHPIEVVDVARVADHFDHVVELVGIDHVGFGSDFDGVGDSLPTGLRDVSGFPNLIAELLRRGYGEDDIEKICSGNTLRVWSEVERIASEMQSRP
jgi:membrane dipeptidase